MVPSTARRFLLPVAECEHGTECTCSFSFVKEIILMRSSEIILMPEVHLELPAG